MRDQSLQNIFIWDRLAPIHREMRIAQRSAHSLSDDFIIDLCKLIDGLAKSYCARADNDNRPIVCIDDRSMIVDGIVINRDGIVDIAMY